MRRVFRAFGRAEAKAYAAALIASAPKRRPDGSPVGGGLAAKIRKATTVRVKRTGYVLQLTKLGQVLTWLVRGTRHQPARPVNVDARAQALADAIADEARAQFAAWDRDETGR